jgi:prophage tail gpP-like protein
MANGQPAAEICEITIGGQIYRDWERVEVRCEYPGTMRTFTVSISEESPTPFSMAAQQIKPGDLCTVRLAGELVITAFVFERQTVMDANTHAVQIMGQSRVADLGIANIDTKKLPGKGQFQGKTFKEISEEICKPFGIKIEKTTGDQSGINAKMTDAQVARTETCHQFLERLSRTAAVHMMDTQTGNFWFHGIGEGGAGTGGLGGSEVREGENIKSMRLIVTEIKWQSESILTGQAAANNKTWGEDASRNELRDKGPLKRYRPRIWQHERGLSTDNIQAELQRRMKYEKAWTVGTHIQGDVTVYGWIRPGGGLWKGGPDETIYCYAPSAMITQNLKAKGITYTQDSTRGTMTTLELVDESFYGNLGATQN